MLGGLYPKAVRNKLGYLGRELELEAFPEVLKPVVVMEWDAPDLYPVCLGMVGNMHSGERHVLYY